MNFNNQPFVIPTLAVGSEVDIPNNRAIFQVSAFSMAVNGQIAGEYYLTNNGIPFYSNKNDDNVIREKGVFDNNNHPAGGSIPVEAGTVELAYKNNSKLGKSIVLGLGEIKSNIIENFAYKFYSLNGLKTTPYYTQVDPSETAFLAIPIESKNTFGYVAEAMAGTLHKQFNISIIIDGKIWLGEMEINYGDGNYNSFGGMPIKANSQNSFKLNPKGDRSKFVAIQVTTYGAGETGRVKVLESNGVGVSFKHIRISSYVFNYNYGFEHPTWKKYNALEAGDVYYKMFNNEGKVDAKTMSIVQGATTPKVATSSVKSFFDRNAKYLIPIGIGLVVALALKEEKFNEIVKKSKN